MSEKVHATEEKQFVGLPTPELVFEADPSDFLDNLEKIERIMRHYQNNPWWLKGESADVSKEQMEQFLETLNGPPLIVAPKNTDIIHGVPA